MSVSRGTLLFAICTFIGYQAGYTLAYKLYPSALFLIIFPAWISAIGFAFVTLPVGYSHSAIVRYVMYKTTSQKRPAAALLASVLVVIPVATVLIWLTGESVHWHFGDPSLMIAPDDDAFRLSNALMNAALKYGITFFIAAWGSTLLMLGQYQKPGCEPAPTGI